MQSAGRMGCEFMGDGLAARSGKAGFPAHAQDFGTVAIGNDQA